MPALDVKPPQRSVPPTDDQSRFEPSKMTLLIDRFMTQFINVGGILIIVAVFLIFAFIFSQIVPLFRGAQVKELRSLDVPAGDYRALVTDEAAELPALLRADGRLLFFDAFGDAQPVTVDLNFPNDPATGAPPVFTAFFSGPRRGTILYGTNTGLFSIVSTGYGAEQRDGRNRAIQAAKAGPLRPIGKPGAPITAIDFGDAGDAKIIAVLQKVGDKTEVHAERLTRKRSLMGPGEDEVDGDFDLTSLVKGTPDKILVSSTADSVIVANTAGEIFYLFRAGDGFEVRQVFKPFADQPDAGIALMDWVFGDVSLVLSSKTGVNRVFSLFRAPGSEQRTFGQTKQFPKLPGAADFFAGSLRNKGFLIGSGDLASLRFTTTEAVRWESRLPFAVTQSALNGKYNRMLFLGNDRKLHLYELTDPHAETSFKALFGKIWYEGYPEPTFAWQSTGGSDEFEPKFSMVPLIIGTLKGTLYAMLFAVPIALLAAVYTSQFLHPKYKALVKPTMEVMASLPSVVLGFLAALWLAPLIDQRFPSIMMCLMLIPVSAMLFGNLWAGLPIRWRILIKPGYEYFVFVPILLLTAWIGWQLGPIIERLFFVVTDPTTGVKTADFRLWWPHVTGLPYEQRNALVVGFVMGFAVIPIFFTIAEDALSNVPQAMQAGSLALGASRWQTAMRIVIPTASAGIFSALMIGLGRAVGETMIVVMATGNTSVMSFNIFSGMRTLSANIAVELPEAPHHSTLYRTLFLGAMLLFLITFVVNTAAEIVRQRLRDRYKTI